MGGPPNGALQEMSDMNGQRVIVTGAAQGLGAAIARSFARLGARVVLMDYNSEGLDQVNDECGGGCLALTVDLADSAATDVAIREALAWLGKVDTLVHNAAILDPKPIATMRLPDFHRTVNVGLQAGFQLARAVWPGMAEAGQGVLIFVSSRSGIEGFVEETAYCAAKHGLEGLSKSLALEGKPVGIASVTVTPGMFMRTPMSERTYDAEARRTWVEPDALAPAFVYLAQAGLTHTGERLSAWDLVRNGGSTANQV